MVIRRYARSVGHSPRGPAGLELGEHLDHEVRRSAPPTAAAAFREIERLLVPIAGTPG